MSDATAPTGKPVPPGIERERGKNPPQDDRFGWHFPADWPESKNTNEGGIQ